ncbi:hypothetical protein [Candidatus Methylomirabilis sp.]|uniref:hypothetical protein n=1 Tax=Candidatus Methylomirabilis sp. TaxID=2032687 RepID=UPI003C769D15
MTRLIRQLEWRGIVMGALLIIGRFTVVWAGNVSPSIEDTGTNVGIGTTSPGSKLHIRDTSGVAYRGLELTSTITGDRRFAITKAAGDRVDFEDVGVKTVMALNLTSGNVGIGTAAPTTKLHVAGDVQVDGNLAAKYQDVAEWVQTPSPLPPGTVVVVDHQERNQVLPASQSYDTRVAGVVSARPGLLLGEAGPDKVKVAQSGRVKVKVDASYGPITVGNLLVTSLTPGHAMRSTPLNLGGALIHRPGTLLGKALEPLEEGRGEILVLLTLQ